MRGAAASPAGPPARSCCARADARTLCPAAACVQAYASLYAGRTRGSRLLFAAERGGPGLELEALRLAAEHAKQGEDTQFYAQARFARDAAPRCSADNPTCPRRRLQLTRARAAAQVVEKINGRLGPEHALDKEWVEQTDKRAAQARLVPSAALSAPALSLRRRAHALARARRSTSAWRRS